MTVQAPIRIHVMGVSGVCWSADDRGRNKWLERWWGKHNSQMGLAGDDEASGTNLPCMHKCARVSFALSLCYSAVLLCDWLLCSLFIFHLVFSLSLCEWGLICSQYFVAVSYPPLYFSAFHFHPTEKKLSERERNDRDLIPEFFFIILSALSCVVPSPPVRSVFIYVTRIKD